MCDTNEPNDDKSNGGINLTSQERTLIIAALIRYENQILEWGSSKNFSKFQDAITELKYKIHGASKD